MRDRPGLPDTPLTRAEVGRAVGRRQLDNLLSSGRLRELFPGVLVRRTELLDPLIRAHAALRYAGSHAALTGLTAAWLHGCRAATVPQIYVVVPYHRCARNTAGLTVIHRRRILDKVVTVQQLPAVALDATVVDLLCTDRPWRALAVADEAAAQLTPRERPEFFARLAELLATRPDRRGTRHAAGLLELVSGTAESAPESWLKLIVVEAGFPPPTGQFEVRDLSGRVRYRLDLSWPELKIALEYDGYEAHDGRARADRQRDDDLARRGWITIRATAADLRDPTQLLGRLTAAFHARGARVN